MSNTDVSTELFSVPPGRSVYWLRVCSAFPLLSSCSSQPDIRRQLKPSCLLSALKTLHVEKNPVLSGRPLPKRALIISWDYVEGISDINSPQIDAPTFEGIIGAPPTFEEVYKMIFTLDRCYCYFWGEFTGDGCLYLWRDCNQMNAYKKCQT